LRQVVLKHALTAKPVAADFAVMEANEPACHDGGVVARVIDLSLDPYVGSRIRGRHMGETPPRPGIDPIPGAAIVEIVESRTPALRAGDLAHTMDAGWVERVALHAKQLRSIDREAAPASAYLSVLGMPGLTAWAGITKLAKVAAGDVLLIDAAAGAVGGTAGQLAKSAGARVVGIAGGAEKCRLVREVYGFDDCVDYKADNWLSALDRALADPPTVHFENVSTRMLEIALARLKPYGRVVLCGLADQYHAESGPAQIAVGPIIGKRAQVMGLVVYDFYAQWDVFLHETAPLVKAGRVRYVEDRVRGLDQAPALFERLMNGANTGKCVVGLSPL
jgi:hypothetical protein